MKNIIGMYLCYVDVLHVIQVTFYSCLLLGCIELIRRHRYAILHIKALGLTTYLLSTIIFLVFRIIYYIILTETFYINETCRNVTYAEVVTLVDSRRHQIFLVTAAFSVAFFQMSYLYFAYSLTKLLYLLTSSASSPELFNNSIFYSIFAGVLIAVAMAILILLSAIASSTPYLYALGKVQIAVSSIIVSIALLLGLIKASIFLQVYGSDSGRGLQLHHLLRMSRIQGVCFVCIVIYIARAIVLILQLNFHSVQDDIYLLFVEVFPTAFMIRVFERCA